MLDELARLLSVASAPVQQVRQTATKQTMPDNRQGMNKVIILNLPFPNKLTHMPPWVLGWRWFTRAALFSRDINQERASTKIGESSPQSILRMSTASRTGNTYFLSRSCGCGTILVGQLFLHHLDTIREHNSHSDHCCKCSSKAHIHFATLARYDDQVHGIFICSILSYTSMVISSISFIF